MGITLSGLVSGMDTDTMVKELVAAASKPLETLQQSKQKYEWQRDSYRTVNKAIKELSTKIFEGVGLQKNLMARTGTSSNESAVSVTPLAGASQESVTMTVKQLANAKTYVGNAFAKEKMQEKMGTDGVMQFKVTDGEGNVLKDDMGKEKIVEITYSKDDRLEDVVGKMNSNKDLNISAFYDTSTGKVVMSSKATGSKSNLEFMNTDASSIMAKLGFTDTSGNALAVGYTMSDATNTGDFQLVDTGKDAVFTINGYETSRASNNFTINGMSYNLKQTTATGEVVTLSTTHDVDKAIDTIKDFVDSYNALIATMDGLLKETKYRDYAPLTDEQKNELSEDQIKKWEEKAKSGILRSDSTLRQGVDEMIGDLSRAVNGTTLSQFGITTSAEYYKERGKLVIDEDKLRAALTSDPDKVYEAFNAKTSSDITVKSRWDRTQAEQSKFENESGFATRIRDALSNLSYNIEKKAGNEGSVLDTYTIGKRMTDIDKKITAMQDKIKKLQERYYSQFAAMEQVMANAESQSSYIASLFTTN